MAENNLLGKSHKQYVQNQIKVRQEILGKSTRDSKELSWMNGKTSWVRLASSIDIENTFTNIKNPKETNTGLNNSSPNEITVQKQDKIDGVKVGEYRVKNILGLDESYMGDVLANNLVLHGGVEKHSFNPDEMSKRYGIAEVYSNTVQTFQAYNSKNGDFGLVAMPGIESVDIKSKSMGSLREASISLRINDPEQLELIETLYLRIGYSVFLEWGNSSYYRYDNSGEGNHEYVNKAEAEPGLLFDFLNPPIELRKCPANFVKRIEDERKKSEGNYDALFGRVKNFSWEFNPNGYYTATLEVISWGDIIESLKIDGYYPNIEVTGDSIEKKDESLLNSYIYVASLPEGDSSTTTTGLGGTIVTVDQKRFNITKKYFVPQQTKNDPFDLLGTKPKIVISEGSYTSPELGYTRPEDFKDLIMSAFAVFGDKKPYYYLRFGDLLDFIKSKLLLYLEDCSTPILDINTDTNSNYCYNPLVNVSADPSKVMINSTIPASIKTLTQYALDNDRDYDDGKVISNLIFGADKFQDKDVKLEPFTKNVVLNKGKEIANVPVGLIMNIYFEKNFLYNTIDQLRDKKTGQLSLYKFIKSLLDEANSCLGGVNKLDLRVDIDYQTLEIYDQVPLYGWKDKKDLPQEFNIFGLESKTEINSNTNQKRVWNDGSFVTNFGLKTELTNEFATITAIGAQANGSVVGEDATFLSKWNFGLVDRFYPKKLDSYRKQDQQEGEDLDQKEFEVLLFLIYNLWSDYSIQQIGNTNYSKAEGVFSYTTSTNLFNVYKFPEFRTDSFGQYVKIQKDFFKALIKLKTKEQNVLSNQIGMLPINLNLEMDGISGIRIYDQIRVNTRFLPSYYPNYLTFIIKGVSHSFNGNRWITKIDTIAQPKVQFEKAVDLTIESEQDSSFQEIIDEGLKNSNPTYFEPLEFKDQNGKTLASASPVVNPIVFREPDNFGSGAFLASRGDRLHYGVDIAVPPGTKIYAPIPGRISRITKIYTDGSHPELRGIKITGRLRYEGWVAQILYAKKDWDVMGDVTYRDAIGVVQDMASSYGEGMTNHIHYAIYKEVNGKRKYLDTENLLKNYYAYRRNPDGGIIIQ